MNLSNSFKSCLIFAIACLWFASDSVGQQMCIKSFAVSFSNDQERIKGLSSSKLLKTIKGGANFDNDIFPFSKADLESMICENPSIRMGVTLATTDDASTQLYLGASYISNRYDGVYYERYLSEIGMSSMSIGSTTNQIGVEGILSKKFTLPVISIYTGFGTTVGYSMAGQLSVDGDNVFVENQSYLRLGVPTTPNHQELSSEIYHVKNSFDQRLFAQLNVGFRIVDKLELGLEGRYGVGYRAFSGGHFIGGSLYSLGLNLKYLIHSCDIYHSI